MSLDQDKLNEMLHRGINDFGATFHAACVILGDKLGLYKGLVAGGPQTPAELESKCQGRNSTCVIGSTSFLLTYWPAVSCAANLPAPWQDR
jgi:hypothetical protein